MKVVINACFGGFSISPLAVAELAKRKGRECHFYRYPSKFDDHRLFPATIEDAEESYTMACDLPMVGDAAPDWKTAWSKDHYWNLRPEDRSDPDLVAVVESLGDKANGKHAKLKVIEIPNGTDYEIDEYDGFESIHERHQSWS